MRLHRLTPLLLGAALAAGLACAPASGPTTTTVAPPAPAVAAPKPGVTSAGVLLTGDGRTAPGPYYLGRPDAPVTLDEYADFQ